MSPQPPAPTYTPPPPPRQPPPPGPQEYQPLSYQHLGQPRKRIPRGVWWGAGTFVALGILGAALSPKEAETAATATTQAPMITQATTAPTEAPTTTAAPVTEPAATEPPVTLSEAESGELALVALLSTQVNPNFGDVYQDDPEGAMDSLTAMADIVCETAAMSDNRDQFYGQLALMWLNFDAATTSVFGDLQGYSKASAYLAVWRCRDQADRLQL